VYWNSILKLTKKRKVSMFLVEIKTIYKMHGTYIKIKETQSDFSFVRKILSSIHHVYNNQLPLNPQQPAFYATFDTVAMAITCSN